MDGIAKNKVRSWKCRSASWDISFCSSDCKDAECDRNHASKLYQDMIKDADYLHSECDFSKSCDDYKQLMGVKE